MAEYKTEQKKILLDFLQKNSEKSFTIEEIAESMEKTEGHPPAKSTVYRLMTKLVGEGKVSKFAGSDGRFVYRCNTSEECKHHLHLQCTECGKLFHLDGGTSHRLLHEVKSAGGFSVSESETVLMGKCLLCTDGGKK